MARTLFATNNGGGERFVLQVLQWRMRETNISNKRQISVAQKKYKVFSGNKYHLKKNKNYLLVLI